MLYSVAVQLCLCRRCFLMKLFTIYSVCSGSLDQAEYIWTIMALSYHEYSYDEIRENKTDIIAEIHLKPGIHVVLLQLGILRKLAHSNIQRFFQL